MYHGDTVPGFPQHPHRGFETVTLVRQGLIDHSDSLGAQARFGHGDVQWLTAGNGIVHARCSRCSTRRAQSGRAVPDLAATCPRPTSASTLTSRCSGTTTSRDSSPPTTAGRRTEVTVVAGEIGGLTPPAPPPNSWASRPESDLAIWVLRLDADARGRCPGRGGPETVRMLYFFEGAALRVAGTDVDVNTALVLRRRHRRRTHRGSARGRVPRAASAPDRRAGRAVRTVRDEHRRRDPSRRSPTTAARSSVAGPGPTTTRPTAPTRSASRASPNTRHDRKHERASGAGYPGEQRAGPERPGPQGQERTSMNVAGSYGRSNPIRVGGVFSRRRRKPRTGCGATPPTADRPRASCCGAWAIATR